MIRILHIEDIAEVTALVRIACRSFHVESVETLREARTRLDSHIFDLLLVDLNLPDSQGMDTVESLAEYHIPMVVLTADPNEAFIEEAAQLGVAEYLTKNELNRVNLPLKLRFVHECSRKRTPRKSLSFTGFAELKPFLTCSALAGAA